MQPAALLAAIVESSDDAIVAKDLSGRIMAWNAAAERMFGYSPTEAIGRRITLIIPPDRLDEEQFVMDRVLEGVGVSHFESVRRRKDGTQVHVSLTVSPVRDHTARIVGASKIVRDITLQKIVMAHLEEERRTVETLERIGTLVTGTLDRDRIVRVVTRSAAELSGAIFGAFRYHPPVGTKRDMVFTLPGTPDDAFANVPGATLDAPFGADDTDLDTVRLGDIGLDRAASASHDAPAARASVVRSYLSVPIVSQTGIPFGRLFLGHPRANMFTDRHERLLAGTARWGALALENAQHYLDAREANQQKDRFLATLSHELRTPLNAILGWAHILDSTAADERTRRRAIETIQRNARAQARLIDDLLDVSRIVSGKLVLRREPLDLMGVVAAALDDVRPAAADKAIELRAALQPVEGIAGDAARLQQVFWNLLSNAVKFTPVRGSVTVMLEQAGPLAQVNIVDTGQGIESELLAHVFDRFRQGDSSTTRRHGGMGLGLGIVKHLVEAHGGQVHAFSDGPGRGARFVVALPVSGSDAAARKAGTDADTGASAVLRDVRILAVDDERDGADMLALALEEAGARVVTAYSASDALLRASAETFQVILADIGMPDVDGCTLMQELRRRRPGDAFLGVAVTAYASDADRVRILESGFDLHLAKPMAPVDVAAAIARALTSSGIPRGDGLIHPRDPSLGA